MGNSIKSSLRDLLKRNKPFYKAYFWIMSAFVNSIKLFVKADERLVLFVSFGGRKCNDSPKAIYEFMRNDSRFAGYKLVWGFVNPKDFPEIEHKVKIDTFKYHVTSLKARCWITNVNIVRGLQYRGVNTFSLYTGHGSPIKKCGIDVNKDKVFTSSAKNSFDACLSQSEFEKTIRSRIMAVPSTETYLTGIPTNDLLVNYDDEYRKQIRKDLGIDGEKKAILYAPTFREYGHLGSIDMPEVDFDKWHQLLGDDFVIIYRAHPSTGARMIKDKEWFIDATNREEIEPLMVASDALITDYSGLMTDYSIMHKPIYLWTYDYEQYENTRGLYFDVRKVLPYAEEEEKLLSMIKDGYSKEQNEMLYRFQQEYATVYGSATRNAVDLIYNRLTKG